jgi:ABC-2 type transport system permease protein
MIRALRIFYLFSTFSLKITLSTPIGAMAFLAGKLLRFALYFLFISYLLSHTRVLAGYDFTQTMIFFLTFNVIDTMAQLLFREVYRFRPLVVSGELDAVLLKPHHPFLRVLLGGIDVLDLLTIFLYVGILIYFISGTVIASPFNFMLFILLLGNGLLIATAFHIMVLALGIITTEVDHTIMIYRDITRIGSLPVDIYREPLRSIFTFVLPIGIMVSFPVKSLLGTLSWSFIGLSFAISAGLLIFSLFLWDIALKKYQSWGG